eukprot:comp19185_c0_seq1/m.21892 comp19185_c0_seq1/g.21892  ORF comp19185_c0_seq1/g.21892 comp19185_c0_seq1/m.21892 type:complete len:304 (-) comp19185_c0_seq1:494-1405(-)
MAAPPPPTQMPPVMPPAYHFPPPQHQNQGYPQGYPQQGYGGTGYGGVYQQPYAYQPLPGEPPYIPDGGMAEQGDPFKGSIGDFSDKAVRQGFVRKVYALVSVMLLCCAGVTGVCLNVAEVQNYVRTNMWVFWTAWGVGFGTVLALACCQDLSRKTPTNYILLTVFTIAESFMVGTVCTFYNSQEVLIALGITCVVTLSLSLFACQTKYDFTGMAVYLWAACWVLMSFGILSLFFHNRIVNMVYSACGALLFVMYLIVDTQMIMGGKGTEMSPEEYVFGALTLFLDIINLFLMILQFIANLNRN